MSSIHLIEKMMTSREIVSLGRNASVRDAARLMSAYGIGAILILEDKRLVGIFTERDLAVRVVGAGLDPNKTRLGTVMTRDPLTLTPEATAFDALGVMQQRGLRHLPVVRDDRVVGMVSIRDLYDVVADEWRQRLDETEDFVFGSGYSVHIGSGSSDQAA